MKKSIRVKVLASALGIALIGGAIAAQAATTYGSAVKTSGLSKYGYCWTTSPGNTVRARIVIGGGLSDKTDAGFVQTDQVSSMYFKDANMSYYVNGNNIANETK